MKYTLALAATAAIANAIKIKNGGPAPMSPPANTGAPPALGPIAPPANTGPPPALAPMTPPGNDDGAGSPDLTGMEGMPDINEALKPVPKVPENDVMPPAPVVEKPAGPVDTSDDCA